MTNTKSTLAIEHTVALAFFLLLPNFFTWNIEGAHDIWWHLKSSSELISNSAFPLHDTYSYTAAGERWNQHSWLGALIYYAAFWGNGYDGIGHLTVFIKTLTIIAVYILSFIITRRPSRALLVAFCLTLAIHHLVPRPHVFSPLLAVLYMYVLHKQLLHIRSVESGERCVRVKKKIVLNAFIIGFLSCLWINTHGEFIVGSLMVFSILFSQTIPLLLKKKNDLITVVKAIGLPALMGFLCNVHGVNGILYPLTAQRYQTPDWNALIFWGESSNAGIIQYILFSVLIVSAFNIRNIWKRDRMDGDRRLEFHWISSWGFFIFICVILSFSYIRMSWMLIFPILFLKGLSTQLTISTKKETIYSIILVVLMFCVFPLRLLHKHPFTDPVKAIQFMKETGVEGRLYSPLIWGGIIIYELNPNILVFADTRMQPFQGQIYKDYQSILHGRENSNTIAERYRTDFLLLPNVVPETKEILRSDRWIRVFSSTNESLYIHRDSDPSNFEKIVRYYRDNDIEFFPDAGFDLVDITMQNESWVSTYCGIHRNDIETIRDTYRYLTNWYDKYRAPDLRHKMYEFLSEKLIELNYFDEANVILRVALDIRSDCDRGNFLLGKTLYYQGCFSDALVYFTKLKNKSDLEDDCSHWIEEINKKMLSKGDEVVRAK